MNATTRPASPPRSCRWQVSSGSRPHNTTRWFLQIQGAISLGASEPEPDGVLLRGDETTRDGRLPTAADLSLIVEVSDSTLEFDRRDKGRIYARAGIPVYWIVNVADRRIEVYTDPNMNANPPAYRTRTDYPPGDAVPIVQDGATG